MVLDIITYPDLALYQEGLLSYFPVSALVIYTVAALLGMWWLFLSSDEP
jgi:hypothetical protein